MDDEIQGVDYSEPHLIIPAKADMNHRWLKFDQDLADRSEAGVMPLPSGSENKYLYLHMFW